MNLNENSNNTLTNFYEQMLHQRNLSQNFPIANERLSPLSLSSSSSSSTNQQSNLNLNLQQNNFQSNCSTLKPPVQAPQASSSSSSPLSTTSSSLLSVSTKHSQQSLSSPIIDQISSTTSSSSSSSSQNENNNRNECVNEKSSDYESKYRAYMLNAAAMAAAANVVFPYNLFNNNNNNTHPSNPSSLLNHHHQNSSAPSTTQFFYENLTGLYAAAVASAASNNLLQHHQQSHHHSYEQNFYNTQQQISSQMNHNDTSCFNHTRAIKMDEPKPSHSYIGLIALAILSTPEKKLVLSDIYQWILDNYTYFHTRGSGWRNSIRHNLSLNDCFMKSGRSSNGKGHYWTIHPANMEDFSRGDFRRRRAQRRVRKSLGLTIPEEDEEDEEEEILTPPASLSPVLVKPHNSGMASKLVSSKSLTSTNNNNNLSSSSIGSSSSSRSSSSSLNTNYSNTEAKPNASLIGLSTSSTSNPLKRNHSSQDNEISNRKKKAKPDHVNNNQSSIHVTTLPLNNSDHENSNSDNQDDGNANENFDENENEKVSYAISQAESLFPSYLSSSLVHSPSINTANNSKKRSFNVDSLLAPDLNCVKKLKTPNEKQIINEINNTINVDTNLHGILNETKNTSPSSNLKNIEPKIHRIQTNLQVEMSSNSESTKNLNDSLNQNRTKSPVQLKLSPRSSVTVIDDAKVNLSKNSSTNFSHKSHLHVVNTKYSSEHHNHHNQLHQNSPFSKIESDNADVENWKLTFSKIMARSYKNTNNSNQLLNNSNNLSKKN